MQKFQSFEPTGFIVPMQRYRLAWTCVSLLAVRSFWIRDDLGVVPPAFDLHAGGTLPVNQDQVNDHLK
jgi:hypothetical protein